jgi:hypothetical protein
VFSVEAALQQQTAATAALQSFVNSTKSNLEATDVAIMQSVADEASARTVADSQLSASITSGSNAHAAYVASNNTRATAIESAASAETAARAEKERQRAVDAAERAKGERARMRETEAAECWADAQRYRALGGVPRP